MKKKWSWLGMAGLLMFGMLVASCDDLNIGGSGNIPSELVGIWHSSEQEGYGYGYTLEFRSNGEFLFGGSGGLTASVSGKTVTLKMEGTQYGTFDYSISNGQMTITNASAMCLAYPGWSPWHKQ
jgi:hypothetical protein